MSSFDWGSFAGGALGAVGTIAGGLLGGSKGGGHSYQYYLDRDFKQTKRLAENQYSWMVQGAKNAGLHPLAVLGTPLSQTSGHYVGDSQGSDYSWLGKAGQQIGRAAGAFLSKEDRMKEEMYTDQMRNQQLENNSLQNRLLEVQIQQTTQDMALQLANNAAKAVRNSGQTPGFPIGADGRTLSRFIPGQNDATTSSKLMEVKPAEITASHPQTPYASAGSNPEIEYYRTSDGGWSPNYSQKVAEQFEDDTLGRWSWILRNRITPSFGATYSAPPDSYHDKPGNVWEFKPFRQAWYSVPKDKPWNYWWKRDMENWSR